MNHLERRLDRLELELWGLHGDNGIRSQVKDINARLRAIEEAIKGLGVALKVMKWTVTAAAVFLTFSQSKDLASLLRGIAGLV